MDIKQVNTKRMIDETHIEITLSPNEIHAMICDGFKRKGIICEVSNIIFRAESERVEDEWGGHQEAKFNGAVATLKWRKADE